MKKYSLIALVLVELSLFTSVYGYGYLTLETGYRYDRIDQITDILDTANPTFLASLEPHFKNLQSYQLGARSALDIPCTMFFLQGAAHYGWIEHGGYNDAIKAGDIKGNTWDATCGLGIKAPFCHCFSAVPLIGMSYDKQHLRISHAVPMFSRAFFDMLEGTRWDSSWYGPWVGISFFFESACTPLLFDAGYEFHYGFSRTSYRLGRNVPALLLFSYDTHQRDMIGNVFHLQGSYFFCSGWFFGARVQYTQWSNRHDIRLKTPPQSETGLTASEYIVGDWLSWHSFNAMIQLGLLF